MMGTCFFWSFLSQEIVESQLFVDIHQQLRKRLIHQIV